MNQYGLRCFDALILVAPSSGVKHGGVSSLLNFGIENIFLYGCKDHSPSWLDAVRGSFFSATEVPEQKPLMLFVTGVEMSKASRCACPGQFDLGVGV